MSIEAMKRALEALETEADIYRDNDPIDGEPDHIWEAIKSLRQAIEQAEKQEPVALETVYETIIYWDEGGGKRSRRELARRIVDLYTTPPAAQRQWVGLTDEEVERIKLDGRDLEFVSMTALHRFARDIQAKLKEKNT